MDVAGKNFAFWLKLGGGALALALLGGCIGSGGPSSDVLRLAAGSDETGTLWHKAGIGNPIFYSLPKAAAGQNPSHQLARLTYLAPRGSRWTPEEVGRFTAHVPSALARCGIGLGLVQLVIGDVDFAGKDHAPLTGADAVLAQKIIGNSPASKGLTLLFTGVIKADQMDADIGGMVISGNSPGLAAIAWQSGSGRRTGPEQIAAHEIGHLLGLGHAPRNKPGGAANINLMQPLSCPKCSFSAQQCTQMKTHPLVRKL